MSDDVNLETTLVINRCHGGFSLSVEAAKALAVRKGVTLHSPEGGYLFVEGGYDRIEETVPRNDPDLVAVVAELGARASGPCADLRVVTVPIVVEILCHDGRESVAVHGGIT